ncbi:N-acetyl-alpha-D-glucosaminyl L-malate synthase [Spirochaetota bacterium]|nr:N-acetyl-alpha-D-glucosaminyl L-malate synthase [Spirochaetota bacterium]
MGGSGIIAHEIAHEMARRYGHTIHFVGLQPPYRMDQISNQCTDQVRFHKIILKPYDVFDFQPYVMALASQLSQLIKKYDIEIIHSHYAIPHALAGILAKQIANCTNVRTVTTLHGTDVTIVGSDVTMKPVTRYSILNSNYVVAVSQYLKDITVKLLDIPQEKIEVIPNFINPARLPNEPKCAQLYKDPMQKKLILHSSNLRKIKAPMDVIEIYDKMVKRGLKNSELAILGDGPYKKEMIARVAELGLTKHVLFLGERKVIYEELCKANLFLLPSRGEAFGLAALEAMACGVPVVAADMGGIREVIDHGLNSYLFSEGKLDEAAVLGMKLLNDIDLYNKISKQAILSSLSKFPIAKVMAAYENIYRETSKTSC